MVATTDDMKMQVAEALFSEGRPVHDLANLKKGNSSPKYKGEAVRLRAEKTVGVRASRYAEAIFGMTEKTK